MYVWALLLCICMSYCTLVSFFVKVVFWVYDRERKLSEGAEYYYSRRKARTTPHLQIGVFDDCSVT